MDVQFLMKIDKSLTIFVNSFFADVRGLPPEPQRKLITEFVRDRRRLLHCGKLRVEREND